jgi:Na+-transporting methylmalonyl-CoA/oxaloacetate decarboxylase beta subunit
MTTLTRTFLAAAIIGFIVGAVVDFSNLTSNPAWTVVMPLGAVFLGLFLISLMLQKEMAGFDQEEATKLELVAREATLPSPRQNPTASPGLAHFKENAI